MIRNGQPQVQASLQIKQQKIDRIAQFKYLECYMTEQLDPNKEIRCRIERARTTFMKMKSFVCNDNLRLKLGQRLL